MLVLSVEIFFAKNTCFFFSFFCQRHSLKFFRILTNLHFCHTFGLFSTFVIFSHIYTFLPHMRLLAKTTLSRCQTCIFFYRMFFVLNLHSNPAYLQFYFYQTCIVFFSHKTWTDRSFFANLQFPSSLPSVFLTHFMIILHEDTKMKWNQNKVSNNGNPCANNRSNNSNKHFKWIWSYRLYQSQKGRRASNFPDVQIFTGKLASLIFFSLFFCRLKKAWKRLDAKHANVTEKKHV